MAIWKYDNNILTHEGQTDVKHFGAEIIKAKTEIGAIDNLEVIVGYHGTSTGEFSHNFTSDDDAQTKVLKGQFPKSSLTWIRDAGMSDDDIRKRCVTGNVFFTWCDSEARVKAAKPNPPLSGRAQIA